MKILFRYILCFTFIFSISSAYTQDTLKFFDYPEKFNNKRFYIAGGTGVVLYATAVGILNNVWYSQYEKAPFHTFDDRGEWRNMDKMGHAFTAYMYSNFAHKGFRWAGFKDEKAALGGALVGFGLQGTLEMLDGYSAKWGFSWSDIGYNTIGSTFFYGQQLLWKEQRIKLKMSTYQESYPDDLLIAEGGFSSPAKRAKHLFGNSFGQRFIKDYNAQTIWASVNIYSFLNEESRFPKWLNIAVGYSAENLYGGYSNAWSEDDIAFNIDQKYPRYSQIFFSLDIDLARLKYKRKWVKILAGILNIIKIPGPALELNTLGKVKFRPFYF